MGLFHCPVGAPYRDDYACIDCGLCGAETTEEMVEASKKIREYLRSQADRRSKLGKIAVCGKGGVGKSTVVTLFTSALVEEGFDVLVIDTDESNPGLYRMLGFEKEPKPLMRLLQRFSHEELGLQAGWLEKDEIRIDDIPKEFLEEKDNLKFLMVGKIDDPFVGCACTMADLSRDFLEKLILGDKEKVIVDTEAGIESFGRGVERSVDTVLIIVEPTFESISLADKISYMADGIGVRMVRAVLNKIPSEEIERKVSERLQKANIKVTGSIYFDLKMSAAALEGQPIGNSQAKEDAKKIVRSLLNGLN